MAKTKTTIDLTKLDEYGIFLGDAPPELLEAAAVASSPRRTPSIPLIVRLGIAALFLVNAITAIVKPSEFLGLVQSNLVLGALPDQLHLIVVRAAAIPDFLIAGLIVSRRNDELAAVGMGLWMGAIALTKVMNLIVG